MEKEIMEQLQMIVEGMAQMEGRLEKRIEESEARTTKRIEESETRIKVYIENQVSDKIKGLFDGYKSALENQALLELANKTLIKRLDDVESRLAALESKTA